MKPTRTILVVDDSDNDLQLTQMSLARLQSPPHVVVVRDGAEALDYLQRRGSFASRRYGNPDLVLLDLKMPRVDGFEVLRHAKTDPRLKAIPVVVFTSSRETEDVRRCYELGANAYVVKPVDFQEFVSALAEIAMFWGTANEPPPDSPTPTNGPAKASKAASIQTMAA
jgi:CheY-like chemotaxis protein